MTKKEMEAVQMGRLLKNNDFIDLFMNQFLRDDILSEVLNIGEIDSDGTRDQLKARVILKDYIENKVSGE